MNWRWEGGGFFAVAFSGAESWSVNQEWDLLVVCLP